MNLAIELAKKKQGIVKEWFEETISSYPEDTSRFLKSQKDPFANPVGQTTHQGLLALFDAVVSGSDRETIVSFLDPIIRIRAVQSFTPSKATGFIFSLKGIVRRCLRPDSLRDYSDEIFQLESRIDAVGLMGFDIYFNCREKITNFKATETRDRIYSAFRRAGLIVETSAEGPGL